MGLPESATARRLLALRVNESSSPSGSITHAIAATLELYCLPDIPSLVAELPSKLAWKALIKTLVHEQFREDIATMNNSTLVHINQLPSTLYGRLALLMQRFRHDLTLARLSILRVRFLLHVTALNSHTSCFHASPRRDRSPDCRLCDLSVPEDIFHFIAQCPALDHVRAMWIPKIYSTPPDPALLVDHVLGISGLDSLA